MRYAFAENLTWMSGKHAMKFGLSIDKIGEDCYNTGGVGGSFTF
jgi:hypothetical protein